MTSGADAVAARICSKAGYHLVGLVGSGAFKHTYHVRDGGQSLALKLHHAAITERSTREIAAMRKCDHPNVAKFIALKSITIGADTYIYLLEEYLSGGSLQARIGKLSRDDIARLAVPLARAIDHIAAKKLVHRDIKPDNVMFRDSGISRPVIVDFGLVRDLNAASLTATWAPNGPGTRFYSAPEQLNNEKGMVDGRTDQFGLGATLGFALFQEHPYAEPGDSVSVTIQRVANWENPSSTFVAACRNADLDPLIRMVRAYPVDRFRTGHDLIAAWESKVKK